MSFTFDLPTTGAVTFTDFITDTSGGHASKLAEATAARGHLRAVLKENRRAKESARDWPGVARAIEDYLPLLLGIMQGVETDVFLLRAEPTFAWRSTLSSHLLRDAPKVALPSFNYELVSCLLTLALALSNRATTTITALGPYERSRDLTDAQRKAGDERLNAAAALLCRASGIFSYLAEEAILKWEATAPAAAMRGRPPQLTREVTTALAKLVLADAERLAIRRLLSRAIMDTTTSPGPPLPPSHPSPSLLSKLYLNVHGLYSAARSLAKSLAAPSFSPASSGTALSSGGGGGSDGGADVGVSGGNSGGLGFDGGVGRSGGSDGGRGGGSGGSGGVKGDRGGVGGDLRKYLTDGRLFSAAIAYKWLGVDAGESQKRAKLGEALGWLEMSRARLRELEEGSGRIGKAAKERAKRKGALEEEVEAVAAFQKSYAQLNRTVAFEPIPPASELLSRIPLGRSALAPKAFELPKPAFGAYRAMGRRAPSPHTTRLEDGVAGMTVRDEPAREAPAEPTYALAKTYW